jgi:hypothetical protein
MVCSVCASEARYGSDKPGTKKQPPRCSTCWRYWQRHGKKQDRPFSILQISTASLERQLFAEWAGPLMSVGGPG